MKQSAIAFALALLASLAVLSAHVASPQLLKDTDTQAMVQGIQQRHDPMSWFTGDWPLHNHFYRPISTLTFEFDNWAHPGSNAGFGATNALIAAISVLALYWLLREITNSSWVSASGTWLFAIWQLPWNLPLSEWCTWIAYAVLAVGIWRHRTEWMRYVPAFLVLLYLSHELQGIVPLFPRMLAWLPGRTASTMTVFALVAMASYARYERLGPRKVVTPEPSPLAPPATRSSKPMVAKSVPRWPWALLSLLGVALALGSYEQAVMLPACLLALAVTFSLFGYRPTWILQAPFWALLLGYLLLRREVLPASISAYQAQQIRTGPGVYLSLSDYIFPPLGTVASIPALWSAGPYMLLAAEPYAVLFGWIRAATAFYQLRRNWILALAGWGMSTLAFLPMAWVKLFEHYHYWPMALRTIFVIALAQVAAELSAIALRPQAIQAPPRRDPAPGSLPRP